MDPTEDSQGSPTVLEHTGKALMVQWRQQTHEQIIIGINVGSWWQFWGKTSNADLECGLRTGFPGEMTPDLKK